MHKSSRHAFAPIAPMPAHGGICRWCLGRRRELAPAQRCVLYQGHGLPHLFANCVEIVVLLGECGVSVPAITLCDQGCAQNDQHPYVGFCADGCRRQYETGRKPMASTLCYECASAETTEIADVERDHQPTYHFSPFGRGSWRS